jgi:hypothetical protein
MGSAVPSLAMAALQAGMTAAQQQAARSAERADAKFQTAQIRAAQDVDERARRARLRQALASQRAQFAARGLNASGSASAVLAGLAEESDRQALDAAGLADSRIGRLQAQLATSGRRSLLAASQPYSRIAFGAIQRNLQTAPLLDG